MQHNITVSSTSLTATESLRDSAAKTVQTTHRVLAAALFGLLLSIPFLNHNWYALTWVAFVPLLYAVEHTSLVKTYVLGLVAGFTLFVSATYWVADFIGIAKGNNAPSSLLAALLYWFYCAHLIALLLVCLNWFRVHTPIHEFILFPVLVAVFTMAFPMVFSMRLGESQINFQPALQATEFLGVHSLDVIIALANITIYRLLFPTHKALSLTMHWQAKLPWLSSVLIIFLWFSYGIYSQQSWGKDIATRQTLRFGLVQPNEFATRKTRPPKLGYSKSYPAEIEMTEWLAGEGAEIIIWPETSKKHYLDNANVRATYKNNVQKFEASLLFQDTENILDPESNKELTRWNSAVMLNDSGTTVGRYNKIKRIPFGEYIPLLEGNSRLGIWLTRYLGGFYTNYSAGDSPQLFKHAKVNLIPLICYETTFPQFVASAVNSTAHKAHKNKGTVLVGLSNDGWFRSVQQSNQHIRASVLRAVENRLPLVHVVNNGPSIVVMPSGKIIFESDAQTAGGYIVDVPHSQFAQGSFYSRHPRVFSTLLGIFLILFIVSSCVARFMARVQSLEKLKPHI